MKASPQLRFGRSRQRGATLLELLLVLAVIAAVGGLIINVTRRLTDAELRGRAVEVVALLRQAYSMAAQSGLHHRVHFDLEKQTVQIEACTDIVRLKKVDEEETVKDELLKELREKPQSVSQMPELLEAASPEASIDAAAALEGVRIGAARCQAAAGVSTDAEGKGLARQIGDDSVRVRRVHAQHLREPAEKGISTINFFPLGYAEKAVVEMADEGGDVVFIIVHRLTGRVEMVFDEFDPEDHMRKNQVGDQVEDDR